MKHRKAQIDPKWENELFSVMGASLKKLGHTPIIINGTSDHVHLLWRHNKTKTISDTLQLVKGNSSHWINDAGLTEDLFGWQGGYGAFTVSIDRVPSVKAYIERQKQHHAKTTMFKEYEMLLRSQGEREFHDFMFEDLV